MKNKVGENDSIHALLSFIVHEHKLQKLTLVGKKSMSDIVLLI